MKVMIDVVFDSFIFYSTFILVFPMVIVSAVDYLSQRLDIGMLIRPSKCELCYAAAFPGWSSGH